MRRALLAIGVGGLMLLLSGQARAQQTADWIGGRVVSVRDAHPLVRATVSLWSFQSQQTVATTTTDGEGRFRFDPVPAGKYRMTGEAANYVTAAYMAHEGYATAIVTGAGVATNSLELRLTPVATISGRVFDGVEPVQRANVMLYREDPGSKGKATKQYSAQTDDEGNFEIARLGAGVYYLSVTGTPWYAVQPPVQPANAQLAYRESVDPSLMVAYPMVFYPDALSAAEATPIEIHGGERIRANMQMHPEHAVTLTMRVAPGEKQNRMFEQLTRTVFGVEEPVQTQMSQTEGVRQFSGLAPGEYNIRELTPTGMSGHSRTVDVRGGSTAIDDETAGETASISVTVHATDGESLPDPLSVSLRGSGGNRTPGFRVDDKGAAEATGVPAGGYRVAFNGGGRALHVVALKVDGKVTGDGRVSVAGNEHVTVDATRFFGADDGGRVRATRWESGRGCVCGAGAGRQRYRGRTVPARPE